MAKDAYGLEITTSSPKAVEAWSASIGEFLEYRLSTGKHLKTALEADPDCVLALCFRGYFLMQLATVEALPKVGEVLKQAKKAAKTASRREQMHVAALAHWHKGQVRQARMVWEEILQEWPADLLALRLHHFLSFWQGDREALRAAPASVLGRLDAAAPGYGFVQGMLGFGLEECGDYAAAERLGKQAAENNANDLWAIHCVAHVLEMQCRHEEGTQWLSQPFGTWEDRNPFKDHVWWHTALFALELGDHDRVLDVYDREVKVKESGFYLDVQNAASLLTRLELSGVDVGDRWEGLCDLAETRRDDHMMPFTDAHFMLALVGGKRLSAARAFLKSLKRFAAKGGDDAADVTARITVPLAQALLRYGEGKHADAADGLYEMRHDLAPLGGSHAQQDVFQQVLIDAMCKTGKTSTARALLAERLVLRPHSQWATDKLRTLQ